MTPQRIVLLVGGIAAAVVLFLLVRPGGDEEAEAPPATQPNVTLRLVPEASETIRITVRDGAPIDGVARLDAVQGERLRIVVRADVADHVHLHGYDLMRDVGPGAPAQLVFTAELAGVFELELEDRGELLAELEVTP